uniref:Acyl-homoserine-lactone synthase n=1 Tax=Rhizobium loti TaxID=381 RepID=M5B2M3_RHILI|nr:probable conjugation factor synthetase, TraI [Mesorhizobium loti NZP2037]
MIELIVPGSYSAFADEPHEMHRLRYRVFKERLDWNVSTTRGFDIDSFDSLKPHYLVLRDSAGRVGSGVRLLPSTGPTMLRDVLSRLLEERTAPEEPSVWESSRFALDLPPSGPKGSGSIAVATYQLLAGMIEFGLSRRLTHTGYRFAHGANPASRRMAAGPDMSAPDNRHHARRCRLFGCLRGEPWCGPPQWQSWRSHTVGPGALHGRLTWL